MLTGSFKGVGIRLDQHPDGTIEIVTPVDGSPAAKSGILPGDILLKVNNDVLDNIRLIDLIKKIGGPIGSQVSLTVRHYDGKEATFTLTREEINQPTVKGYQRKPRSKLGLLPLRRSQNRVRAAHAIHRQIPTRSSVLSFEQLLKDGMKGTILDLRFNPGGQLDQAEQIINMLIDKGQTIVTTQRPKSGRSIVQISNGEDPLLQPPGATKFPLIVLDQRTFRQRRRNCFRKLNGQQASRGA